MSELDFGLVADPRDFEYDVGVLPFSLVFCKVEVVVDNGPRDFFPGDQVLYRDVAAVQIKDAMREIIPDFIGVAFNVRPPSAHIVDCREDCFRGLVHREGGGEVALVHGYLRFLDVGAGCPQGSRDSKP